MFQPCDIVQKTKTSSNINKKKKKLLTKNQQPKIKKLLNFPTF